VPSKNANQADSDFCILFSRSAHMLWIWVTLRGAAEFDDASERRKDQNQNYDRELSVTHRPIAVPRSHEEDYQLQNEFIVANK